MAQYNITHDDGSGRPMRTYVSKDGRYRITTNAPGSIKSAGGVMAVGNGARITINHQGSRGSLNQHVIAQMTFHGQPTFVPAWRHNSGEQWQYYKKRKEDGSESVLRYDTYQEAAAFFARRGIVNFR